MDRAHYFQSTLITIARITVPVGLALLLTVLFTLFLGTEKGQGATNAPIAVCKSGCKYSSLQQALDNVQDGDSILVGPGTYTETGKIYITQTLTIEAEDANNRPVIMPAQDTGTGAEADRAWIVVNPGITVTLRNLVFDGDSKNIIEAIQLHGTGIIEGNEFRNIQYTLTTSPANLQNSGTAIFLDHSATIRNNTFLKIGRVGALACGTDARMTFQGNTYTGKNASDRLDVAAWAAGGAQADILNNKISDNIGSDQGLWSAGIRIDATSLMCQNNAPSSATITDNTILDSRYGIFVGGENYDTSDMTAHFNRIVGNMVYGILGTNSTIKYDAQYNWWGCNQGPGNPGCDDAFYPVDGSNPLQLSVSASPTAIVSGEQADVTASVKYASSGYAPDGTQIDFKTNLGSITSAVALNNGDARATYSANGGAGTATVSATLDHQTVSTQIVVHPKQVLIYFPKILNNYSPFSNGDFTYGFSGWAHGKGPFVVANGTHGSGLPQSIISIQANPAALLGDSTYTNGSIPVGYGYIAKTFTVEKSSLNFDYHLTTFDVALAAGGYYDTFEVSINRRPDQVTDAERKSTGCDTPDAAPASIKVLSPGLVFCTGGKGEGGTQLDYGTKSLNLDLSAYEGQNVTIYFTLWSREYDAMYYDDHAFYNTWVTIDNVNPQ